MESTDIKPDETKPALSAVIIDDDPAIRGLVEAVLTAEGYSVSPFAEGKSACEALEKTGLRPSVIVLDMMMPGMHGLDVLTRIKLRSDLASIPVIMLTAESAPQDMMNGYAHGADYYITKPFTRQQLVFGLGVVSTKA